MERIWNKPMSFAEDECGAVTVDWVVGAAAGVALAITVMNSLGGAAQDHAELVGETMSSVGIPTF